MSKFKDAAKIGFEEFRDSFKNDGSVVDSMNNVYEKLEELDEDDIDEENTYDAEYTVKKDEETDN